MRNQSLRSPVRNLSIVCLLCLLAGHALAADAPPPPDVDAAAWLQAIYAAFTSKSWGVLAGLVLIAAVWPIRRFGPTFFKGRFAGVALAFVTALAATLGATLAVGAELTLGVVGTAISTAAAAAGVWEWLKDMFPGVSESAEKSSSSPAPTGAS